MQPVEKIFAEMPIPEEILLLKEIFRNSGASLYVVGGAVRDFVLHFIHGHSFSPKDFDLVTDFHPDDVLEILKNAIWKGDLPESARLREVGKSFGVVLITIGGKDYEIATFREDAKTGDGRRPDYVEFSTIDKDAARRDLTINALYYDLNEKCVIDFHGGIKHLYNKNSQVVFVGDVQERIYEDRLRIMRFVRFHCRMNHGIDIHKDTREAIKNTKLRPYVSDERIREEFIKGIKSCEVIQDFIWLMADLDLLGQVFDGLKVEPQLCYQTLEIEPLIAQILRYNDSGHSGTVKDRLNALKYTSQESTDIAFLIKLPFWQREEQVVDFRRAFSRVSLNNDAIYSHIEKFACFNLLDDMIKYPYPVIRGEEVMGETGLQGKALGEEIVRREIDAFKHWRTHEGSGIQIDLQ